MNTPTSMHRSSARPCGITPASTESTTARATAACAGPNICTACFAPLIVTLLNRSVSGLAGRFGDTTASSVVNPSLLFASALQKAAPAGPVFEPMIKSMWATSFPSPTSDSPKKKSAAMSTHSYVEEFEPVCASLLEFGMGVRPRRGPRPASLDLVRDCPEVVEGRSAPRDTENQPGGSAGISRGEVCGWLKPDDYITGEASTLTGFWRLRQWRHLWPALSAGEPLAYRISSILC